MVSNCTPNDDLRTSSIHEQKTPTTQYTAADGMSAVRTSLERRGISQSGVNIIMSSYGGNQLSRSINAILRDRTLSVMNGIRIHITQMKLKF